MSDLEDLTITELKDLAKKNNIKNIKIIPLNILQMNIIKSFFLIKYHL